MAGWTNRGKNNILGVIFNADTAPTSFSMVLLTSATAPTVDTESLTSPVSLTQLANGNGYTTGGYSLSLDNTDFPNLTEDDTNDRGTIDIKTIPWPASGGPIPVSGDGARYAVMLDNTGDAWYWWDLTSDRTVSDGQTLSLTDGEIRINDS